MNYKELNKDQRDRMKQITAHEYTMEWENPEFMDDLLGRIPQIRRGQEDEGIKNELAQLNSLLDTYDSFLSDKGAFLEEIKNMVKVIQKKDDTWHGINIFEIERYIKIHDFCLISGEGGIGKSYFINCFESLLESKKIEHLCLYGKFEKNISRIDVEEINKASEKGFVFIFDAINELSEEGQRCLLNLLKEFKKNSRIRIVISYRTNTMAKEILNEYQALSKYEYKFPGVSFESALCELLKFPVPDVYLYEDILYSNNALLLSMLCDVLSSDKIVDEEENGVASVTFILEHFIKTSIKKVFKNDLSCKGIDIWKDTKRVAQWMYHNGEKEIDEESLLSVIKTGQEFLVAMMQMSFLDSYERDGRTIYYFVIDSLTDFLIARSLFEDISGKEDQEKVAIIRSKAKCIPSIEEALIISIFDNVAPDYITIKNLLSATELMELFDTTALVKIHFTKENINTFQEIFKPNNHGMLLKSVGGFTDKPFNCSNYLFQYYCKDSNKAKELSEILAGYHFQYDIKNRLKNVLYFTTLNDRADRRDEEAYYFALLCCAAPNIDVRSLAMKLLYEVVAKNEGYVEKLINDYDKILDFYIQEAIIYALCQMKKEKAKITSFFNEIITAQRELTAKSIRRIATYLGSPYSFIMWEREDLYRFDNNAKVSEYLNEVLFRVDLMNKNFLPFRYWGKNHVDMSTKFLANDKNEIKKVNDYLYKTYSCVRDGECSGSWGFEHVIMSEINNMVKIETIDMNSFLQNLEKVLIYIFEYYGITLESKNVREEDFINSVFMKCVDIATGIYYGSLMCNHYTDNFVKFNSTQNCIGYEVYDPLEFGEEVRITAPIPTYQDYIERLGDYVINSIEQPTPRDIRWVKDVELTRRNIIHLIEPVNVRKQEWVLLAGRVSLREEERSEIRWRDTYDIRCCSSEKETIRADGNARYLTIELEEYVGELNAYPENQDKPWLCKYVKNIMEHSDILDETSLVLPPAEILKYFNLKLNVSDLSWETQAGEKVIRCNNNKNSYYRDPIGGTVFIRKEYYDLFVQKHRIKYFAFCERSIPETGYAAETSLHFEILDSCIVKEIRNDVGCREDRDNPVCTYCPHTNIVEMKRNELSEDETEWIKNLFNDLCVLE